MVRRIRQRTAPLIGASCLVTVLVGGAGAVSAAAAPQGMATTAAPGTHICFQTEPPICPEHPSGMQPGNVEQGNTSQGQGRPNSRLEQPQGPGTSSTLLLELGRGQNTEGGIRIRPTNPPPVLTPSTGLGNCRCVTAPCVCPNGLPPTP